jgi:Protein of unknown function (DUF3800)
VAFHAVIDESGQRAVTQRSSDHFVMSAVVYRDINHANASALLARLRADLNRQPGHRLHWLNLKTHDQRLHAATTLGQTGFIKLVSVVVSKRLLTPTMPHEHMSYLYTFRLLLERLSWLAEDEDSELSYTLSHVRRFPKAKLRQYEARLRLLGERTSIKWNHLDPAGGRLDNDENVEQLQLADLVASATATAFEPNEFGQTEPRYLRELAPRIYPCRRYGVRYLPSYGLKMHPWNDAARERYPWVLDL